MSFESVMPSNHLILCHPLLQPSILPSIRVFSNESVLLIRGPKYWTWLSNFHFDYMDLCRQSNISVLILCLVCHCFSKEQASFNLMAVVIIHSDFGAQEKNVCHCCHLFPIYLPWSHGTRCHDLRFFSVKPAFSLSFSASSRGSVIPLCFLPYGWSHLKP